MIVIALKYVPNDEVFRRRVMSTEYPARFKIEGQRDKFAFLVDDHCRVPVQFHQFDVAADNRLHLLQREV